MIHDSTKARLFEEHRVPTEGGDVLYAKLMLPKAPIRPRRVVFIAPLIGAGAAQPLVIFRNFTRRGSILFSFEYRGHPRSTGTFELDRTTIDVQHALFWAWNYACERGLALHGFTMCYGTTSLLAQFTGQGCGRLLKSVSAVSGLFSLDRILRFEDFAAVFSRRLGRELSAAAMLAGIAEDGFDWNGDVFRDALHAYLTRLFPELRVGRDYFEELQYSRVDIPRTLLQLSRARYLQKATVPPEVPCHFFYGRNDDVMSLHTPEGREQYTSHIRSLIPHATLHEEELDHFGRGPDHDAVIDELCDIFERYDSRPTPLVHPGGVTFYRDDAANLLRGPSRETTAPLLERTV